MLFKIEKCITAYRFLYVFHKSHKKCNIMQREKHGAKPTHEGAESIICELHAPLKERSERYKKLLEELSVEGARPHNPPAG